MPEVESAQMIPYQVDYACDECGLPMESTIGIVLTSNPPLYPHSCVNGHKKNLRDRYPTIRYKTLLVE